MTAKWLSRIASLASLAAASGFASAQEPPPKQEPPPEEKQEKEEVEPPIHWSSVSLGLGSWIATGSRPRMYQYATPPNGLIVDASLLSPWAPNRAFAHVLLSGSPGEDFSAQGQVIFNQGNTMVKGRISDATYFAPTWLPVDESSTRVSRVVAEQTLRPDLGLFYAYRGDRRAQRFESPLPSRNNRTDLHAIGIEGRILGGQGGIVYRDHRFYDDSNYQPQTLQRGVLGHYGTEFGPVSIEGLAGYTSIEQAGRDGSSVRTMALNGMVEISPLTLLQFNFSRDDMDLDVVQNAYVRKRLNTGVRLRQRLGKWSANLGYRHREYERMNATHNFVDIPKWNTFDARIAGRINDDLRLTLRGTFDDLTNTASMSTEDPRQLYWGDRTMLQAKVDGGNDIFSGYASYTFRLRKNDVRNVDVRWSNLSLGSSYAIRPDLLAYAEVAYDTFATHGLDVETGVDLGFYFPDSFSLGFGLDWTRSATDSLSTSLNYFSSNNSRGTQLTLQYRRQIATDHSLDLVVAPWRYEDRLYNLTGYNTTFLQVRYTVRY